MSGTKASVWFVLLLVFSVESGSGLQTTRWAAFGPVAGSVYGLAVDPQNPQTLYAVSGGIFKSTDGGSNWRRIVGPDVYASAVLVDPRNNNNLYVETYQTAFLKSTDAGVSWKSMSIRLTDGTVIQPGIFKLAIDPQNSTTIYAASSDGCQGPGCPPSSMGKGLFKSLDGGDTWIKTPLSSGSVFSLKIDPEQPLVLYAGTPEGRYQSINGGDTWRRITLTDEAPGWDSPVAFDPQDSSVVYMGHGGGIYKSVDRGASWKAIWGFSYIVGVMELQVHALDRRIIYAYTLEGTFKSNDAGNSWVSFYESTYILARDPKNPGTVYGRKFELDETPLVKSTDGGTSWRPLYSGLVSTDVQVAVDPQNPDSLFAWTRYRLFKSTDGARRWQLIFSTPLVDDFSFIELDPRNARTIYAGKRSGIYKSTDGGLNWTAINFGLPAGHTVRYVRIDSQNSNTLYAAVAVYGNDFWNGLFKSTNGGLLWDRIGTSLPETRSVLTLNVSPHKPQNLYASFYDPTGAELFRSTDGGLNWTNVAFPAPGRVTFIDVVFDPLDSNTLYAVATCALLKSSDGGISWITVNPRINGCFDFASLQAESGSTLYAATQSGLFKTTDGGASWTVESGVPQALILNFAITRNSNRKYAAVSGGGVYATFDSLPETQPPSLILDSTGCVGQSWNLKVNSGQANVPVRLLGTSAGHAWEVNPWNTTNALGVYEEKGTFARQTEGHHTLYVDVGGDTSNEVNIQVRPCAQ